MYRVAKDCSICSLPPFLTRFRFIYLVTCDWWRYPVLMQIYILHTFLFDITKKNEITYTTCQWHGNSFRHYSRPNSTRIKGADSQNYWFRSRSEYSRYTFFFFAFVLLFELLVTKGLDYTVSGGYPPKPINEDTITLSSAGLRDGDTLNIKILDTPIQQTTAAPLLHESTSNPPTNNEAVATQNGYIVLRVIKGTT
jgi:hypothetical protein